MRLGARAGRGARAPASPRRTPRSAAVVAPLDARPRAGARPRGGARPRQDRRAGRPRARVAPARTRRRLGRWRSGSSTSTDEPSLRPRSRRARTRASTTGPATTGRTPTAARRRPSRLARGGASRPAAAPAGPGQPVRAGRRRRSGQPVRPGPAPGTGVQPVRERRRPARRQPVRPDAPGPADGRRRCAAQADAARPRAGASSAATRRCCSTTTRPRPTPSSGRCRPIPRAQRLRDLYPQLPERAAAGGHHLHRDDRGRPRHRGHARRLVDAVCDDLARRGFAAVEAYPERGRPAGRDERGHAGVLAERRVPDRRRRRAVPGRPPRAVTADGARGRCVRSPLDGRGGPSARSVDGSRRWR